MRYGIPAFKMEKRHLERRIEQMRAEGTKFRTSTAVGRDIGAAELRARYDAVVIATGATAWRELHVPGRELAGIHQAMEYLPLANRVCEGDLEVSPMSAAGKHVVIVGGGDTGADCLGTAVREGAASVTQLDIYAAAGRGARRGRRSLADVSEDLPAVGGARGGARPADRRRRRTRTRGSSRRPRSASPGDEDGHVRALHLVEVDARAPAACPAPGGRSPPTSSCSPSASPGPTGTTGSIDQLGLALDPRGTIARDAGLRDRTCPVCTPPGTPPAGSP